MEFGFYNRLGVQVAPKFQADFIMALAFHLMHLEQQLGMQVDRSTVAAPEVVAAEVAWSGGVGIFGRIRVRAISG